MKNVVGYRCPECKYAWYSYTKDYNGYVFCKNNKCNHKLINKKVKITIYSFFESFTQKDEMIKELEKYGVLQSMSRRNNCLDNSPMENFFGILKQEMYYGRIFKSYEELKREIEKYIRYYNYERIKEKLGWKSPVEYREQLKAA